MALSGLDGLLAMIARGTALSEIAANSYVAPSDPSPGAADPPPAPGLLADLSGRPRSTPLDRANAAAFPAADRATAEALAAGVGQDAAGAQQPASRSLAGLRPPRPESASDAMAVQDGSGDPLGDDALAPAPLARPIASVALPSRDVAAMDGSTAFDAEPGGRRDEAPAGPSPASGVASREDAEQQALPSARQPPTAARTRDADRPVSAAGSEGLRSGGDDPGSAGLPARLRADAPATAPGGLSGLDGWTLRAEAGAAPQVERAGIIASFILNAAMIPGWPPPKPFAPPGPDEALGRLARLVGEGDPLAGFRARGAKPGLVARLRRGLAKLAGSRRLRVLLGLAALSSAVEELLTALNDELGRLSGRDEGRGSPARGDPEGEVPEEQVAGAWRQLKA